MLRPLLITSIIFLKFYKHVIPRSIENNLFAWLYYPLELLAYFVQQQMCSPVQYSSNSKPAKHKQQTNS